MIIICRCMSLSVHSVLVDRTSASHQKARSQLRHSHKLATCAECNCFQTELALFPLIIADLQSIRKLLGNDESVDTSGENCPSCDRPFDKGKKRKLIDTCGHERCYSCMFKNEKCPICCSPATAQAKGSDLCKCPRI